MQRVYTSFVLLVALVALLGMGRVWLSASAAKASIEVTSLQSQIKAAQNEGDILEVRKSSLATPSRIQAVASTAMGMASAASSTYLDLANVPTVASLKTPSVAAAGTTGSAFSRMLEKAVNMAAGEAHQLLVGDVGLASE
ncbi:MAG: cell division protein FtsL [Coriobacteriia bacterium]|nr:cell division protein FtsL [Coriobacteriia bacterium]